MRARAEGRLNLALDGVAAVGRGAIAACRSEIGSELAAEVGALREQVVIDATRYCHASPV